MGKINPDTNEATELIERVEAALSPVVSTVEDKEQVCERYLASLQLEELAPEYKKAKQHIEAFIQELDRARLSLTPSLKKMNVEALRLLRQEFKNNWLSFFEAISIEPGYFQTFEELLQALEREMAVPYGDLESHEKDFLRGWDEIYGLACAEADRRKHGANPNLSWFDQP